MDQPSAEAEMPLPKEEEVIVDDPQLGPPADEGTNAGDTFDKAPIKDVLALHKLLKDMEKDNEDADGNVRKLRDMLSKSSESLVDAKNPEGVAPLHVVARRGLKKAAEVLLGAKADTLIQDEDAFVPLHYACQKGNLDVAELLLGKGAQINAQINARIKDRMSVQINAQDRWQETPLHKACNLGYPDLVELLVNNRANTNIIDEEGMPPLYITARENEREMLKTLLYKGGADINYAVRQDDNWTALHVAAYFGHVEIVAILREAHADLELPDGDGSTPLMLATKQEHLEVMRELLCGKEDKSREGHVRQREDAGHRIRDHGPLLLTVAHVDAQDHVGETPLIVAAAYGFLAGVRLLMKHGADCNKRNHASRTPIIFASQWRNREVVLALLQHEKPAEINAQDEMKQTALHKAAFRGHAKVLQLLLNNGANLAIRDDKKRLPLHLASLQGNVAVVNLLLEHGADQQLETRDQDGMTPLLIASKAGDKDVKYTSPDDLGPEELNEEESSMPHFKSGRHGAVVELLLQSGASPEAKTKDEKTALRLALESQDGKDEKLEQFARFMKFNKEQARLRSTLKTSASAATRKDYDDLLDWAVEDFSRHPIAKLLISKGFTSSAPSPPDPSSAIAWATWANLPGVLWLLIAKTPRNEETIMEIRSLLTSLECLKPPASQRPVGKEKLEKDRKGDGAGSKKDDYSIVRDQIRDPPVGLLFNVHEDSQYLKKPLAKQSYSDILEKLEAAVVHFYKGKGRFGSIQRYRNVHEVIYTMGPQSINEVGMESFRRHIEDLETSFSFTWVHLPSTNMEWMNDLLQAIMEREGYTASQFRQLRAFFKDSWVQVPDKFSDSRIMRPRFATRDDTQDARDDPSRIAAQQLGNSTAKRVDNAQRAQTLDGEQENTDGGIQSDSDQEVEVGKEENGKPERPVKRTYRLPVKDREGKDKLKPEAGSQAETSTAASAVYMPYLSFSLQCTEEDDKRSKATNDDPQPSEQEASKLIRLQEARKDYCKVLDDHKAQIIHGSSTLDEWYYHFDPKDKKAIEDRNIRNGSQVVHTYLNKSLPEKDEKQKKPSHWPLIRVNQLWVWTLGNKWLMTASSFPIDGDKDTLLQGVLEHLDRQKEFGGSRSQPDTAAEMSKLIVDYCIESYERRPEGSKIPEGLLSIRQMFSKAINDLGRRETKLFNDFKDLTQKWGQKRGQQTKKITGQEKKGKIRDGDNDLKVREKRTPESDRSRASPSKADNDRKRSGGDPANVELTKSTKKAQDLSEKIKDIRDELNILKAAAQYQQDVQEALYMSLEGSPSQELARKDHAAMVQASLSAAHVVNDIREMDSVADRIQTGVNTTLSLQQSEAANLQATLAADQNRTLMIFTVVTIFFLPLSFLSSMFALDVASFQQAPGWVFAVMFSVSIAFFIPFATAVPAFREDVGKYTSKAWRKVWRYTRDAFRTKGGEGKAPSSPGEEDSSKSNHSRNELRGPALPRSESRKQPDVERDSG